LSFLSPLLTSLVVSRFDAGGKGMLHEKDFVDGWLELAEGQGGEQLIRNLKQLVAKDNLLL
jgi:hypothetical protein